jgi:hypothetical protein
MIHHRKLPLALAVSALLMSLYACTQDPPVHPVTPPAPDTTSHDWVFSMHRLSDGAGSNRVTTIAALSPDFVLMSSYDVGPWAILWNGRSIERILLPFKSISRDTCSVCPPALGQYKGSIYSLWFFRRDNFWIADLDQTQHTTISAGDSDTMVYVTGRPNIPDIGATHIWAKDSANVFFANYDASRVFRWRHGERSWTTYTLTYPDMWWSNEVFDLWGTSNESVFLHTNGGLRQFDGVEWRTIWNREMPSLCDSAYFGMPMSAWAAADEDSMWIAGLFIGRLRKDGGGRVTYIARPENNQGVYGVGCVRGSAKNNVFFIGLAGYIAHYNGASFKVFDEFAGQGIGFTKAVVFENEVFIIGSHPFMGGIFVHGRRR